jgi:hypothetical protein
MSNNSTVSKVKTSQSDQGLAQRIFTFKATQWVWLVFGILQALFALRFGLKLIGGNPDSPIVNLIYGFTNLFLSPFTSLVGSPATGNMVLELSTLFAMLIYALLAWAIERTVWLIFYRPRGPVVAVTETTTAEQHTTL